MMNNNNNRRNHVMKKNERKREARREFLKLYRELLDQLKKIMPHHNNIIQQRLFELDNRSQAGIIRQKFIKTLKTLVSENDTMLTYQMIIDHPEPIELVPGIDFRKETLSEQSQSSLINYINCLGIVTETFQLGTDMIRSIVENAPAHSGCNSKINELVEKLCGNGTETDKLIGSLVSDMAQKVIEDPVALMEKLQTQNFDEFNEMLEDRLQGQDMNEIGESLKRMLNRTQQTIPGGMRNNNTMNMNDLLKQMMPQVQGQQVQCPQVQGQQVQGQTQTDDIIKE